MELPGKRSHISRAKPSVEISGTIVGHGERIAVLLVAELELALTRIIHETSTAASYLGMSAAFCSVGLLDVP